MDADHPARGVNIPCRNTLANTSLYADPVAEPAWKTAWREYEVSDAEFEMAVCALEKEFPTKTDWIAGELLHVLGLRIRFARIGVVAKTKDEVVTENKARIDQLADMEKLPDFEDDGFGPRSSWGGLAFSESSTPYFQSVYKHYLEKLAILKEKRYPAEATELLKTMSDDVAKFFRSLCANNVEASPYFNVPILAFIEPKDFVDRLLSMSGFTQANVITTLKQRYSQSRFSGQLVKEHDWVQHVVDELKQAIPGLRPSSKDRLQILVSNDLEPLLASLQDQEIDAQLAAPKTL